MGWLRTAGCALFTSLLSAAEPADQLRTAVELALEQSAAPAMTAAIFDTEEILARTDLGLRRADKSGKVDPEDLWHIGSDAKAMTATLAARLVEKELLSWDTTVAEALGSSAGELNPQARTITLSQLLSHSAGLDPNPSVALRIAGQKAGARNLPKQRLKVAQEALGKAPLHEPGTKFLYSNTGYIVAGAMIEKQLGMSWEKAIEQEVFAPLGITSAGFGAPKGASQPRGHRLGPKGVRQAVDEGYAGDNPAIYGPAGGIHLSLADWIRFLQDQILGHQGEGKLLKKESYQKLHEPVLKSYAMGWIVGKEGKVLQHDGSNTYWYATVRLDLEKGGGMVAIANDAAPTTAPAMHRALSTVRRKTSDK